jgi:hypothetical protein
MTIVNSRCCVVLAAAVCIAGCGKQERSEAVQLAKALTATTVNSAKANDLEKDFVNSARAWCGGIVANGAGRGAELDQNAAVAAELAKSAVAISAQLSQVRQAIDAPSIQEEYPQHVRDVLTTQLTQRQRSLQDMRALLEQAAPQFLQFKQNQSYKGDTYPDGIGKLDAVLHAYQPPADVAAAALADLKSRYGFGDNAF